MSIRNHPDVLPPGQARTLLALIAVHHGTGRATVRAVATNAGRSVQTTHERLGLLERRGLVAWEPGRAGTLRPLVEMRRVG